MNRRDWLVLGTLLLINILLHRVWFFSFSLLSFGDFIYHYPEHVHEFLAWPQVWDASGLGSINLAVFYQTVLAMKGFIALFGASYAVVERIVFMWPLVIISVVSIFFLLRYLCKNTEAVVLGSLVWNYNTYFLLRQTDQLPIGVAISFAPLVLYFFLRAVHERSFKLSLAAGLIAAISGFYDLRILMVVCWLLLLYGGFRLVVPEQLSRRAVVMYSGVVFLVIAALNIFWLLPLLSAHQLTSNSIFDRGLFGESLIGIRYAITLFNPYWTGAAPAGFKPQPIPFYEVMIPLLAFTGLVVQRKKLVFVFFGLVAVIGVFLTKQSGPPFPDMYRWLFDHLPGFNAFRESTKFFFVIGFAYAVLIAGLIDWLEVTSKNHFWLRVKQFTIMGTVFLFVLNMLPFFNNAIGTLFIPQTIPSPYITAKNHILAEQEFSRVLWVPADTRWSVETYNHPKLALDYALDTKWSSLFSLKRITAWFLPEDLKRVLTAATFQKSINSAAIKYIILPLPNADDGVYERYGVTQKYFQQILDGSPALQKLDWHTGPLVVYENKEFRPRIYITRQPETAASQPEFRPVAYLQRSNTSFELVMPLVSPPYYLYFSESYSPGWKISVPGVHKESFAGFNQYYITSREQHIHLYHDLQPVLDRGVRVSIIAGAIIIALLLWPKKKRS